MGQMLCHSSLTSSHYTASHKFAKCFMFLPTLPVSQARQTRPDCIVYSWRWILSETKFLAKILPSIKQQSLFRGELDAKYTIPRDQPNEVNACMFLLTTQKDMSLHFNLIMAKKPRSHSLDRTYHLHRGLSAPRRPTLARRGNGCHLYTERFYTKPNTGPLDWTGSSPRPSRARRPQD